MKFAEKCPKCGGDVQTKSVRKSLGLGFVNVPVAQFCLNPTCDWYQDFSEAKKPDEIQEDTLQIKIPSFKNKSKDKSKDKSENKPKNNQPEVKKSHVPKSAQKSVSSRENRRNIIILTGVILFSAVLLFSLTHLSAQSPDVVKTNASLMNTTPVPTAVLTETPGTTEGREPKKYSVKIDIAHGFNPLVVSKSDEVNKSDIIINRSDIVVWVSEEDIRPRLVLVSKDGLFENKTMQYADKFSYQFNRSGDYTFILAEFPSLNEFQNDVSRVVVK